MITVVVVDDHAMVRTAIARHLTEEQDMKVIGEAADAREAMELVVEHRPAILLMDIDMPGPVCFEVAREVRQRSPETRVIFLSAHFHDHYVEQALEVEARGYLTKAESQEALVAAIRKVAAGGVWFSDEVRRRIVFDEHGVRLSQGGRSRASHLTRREVEVLRYLARGMSKKEIAQLMHVSVKTVDSHSSNLMSKLDIHDRVELARFAIREGLAEA